MISSIIGLLIACTFIISMPYVCLYFEFQKDVNMLYKYTGHKIKLEKGFVKRIKQYYTVVRLCKIHDLSNYYYSQNGVD